MPKTIKQQWVSERLFTNFGSLIGITVRLTQISKAASTLSEESEKLMEAARIITGVNLRLNQPASLEQFEKRRS